MPDCDSDRQLGGPERPEGSDVISTVIDLRHPRYAVEALRWYASLTRIVGVPATDLRLHVVGDGGSPIVDYLRSRGVGVREIPSFDPRHPPCNKIGGALSLCEEGPDGLCVLTDSDVAFFEDPRAISIPDGHVGMRPVDIERPELRVLSDIFAAAGVDETRVVATGWQPGGWTLAGNGNGGFYLIPAAILADVSREWGRWATWLLDRELLPRVGERVMCVDQVAMALALADLGIGVIDLDPKWNLPTHIATPDPPIPAMLHYHTHVAETGEIVSPGVPPVDSFVAKANEAVDEVLRECPGAAPIAPATDARRTITLAGAGGLTEQPELISAYSSDVGGTAGPLLVIVADEYDLHRVERRVRDAMASVGVDPDDCPDMVIVPPSADVASLQPRSLLTDSAGCALGTDLPRWRARAVAHR
ncbi:MAG TPA: hypothetical protein VJ741_04345 [Solirubrobacteraceae bacterium]|nr:hypothetical protein [Solirubrobacteraceae bacterium]